MERAHQLMEVLVDLPVIIWHRILDTFIVDLRSYCKFEIACGLKYKEFYRNLLQDHVLQEGYMHCSDVSRNVHRHSIPINISYIMWCAQRRTSLKNLFLSLPILPHLLTCPGQYSFPLVESLTLSSAIVYMTSPPPPAKKPKLSTMTIDQAMINQLMLWFPNLSSLTLDITCYEVLVECIAAPYRVKLEPSKVSKMIISALAHHPSPARFTKLWFSYQMTLSAKDYVAIMQAMPPSIFIQNIDLDSIKPTNAILDHIIEHVETKLSKVNAVQLALHKQLVTPDRMVKLFEAFRSFTPGIQSLSITHYEWNFSFDSHLLNQVLPNLVHLRSIVITSSSVSMRASLPLLCATCMNIESISLGMEFQLHRRPPSSNNNDHWLLRACTSEPGQLLDMFQCIQQSGHPVIRWEELEISVFATRVGAYHPPAHCSDVNRSIVHIALPGRGWKDVLPVIGRHIMDFDMCISHGMMLPVELDAASIYTVEDLIVDIARNCNSCLRSFTAGFFVGPTPRELRAFAEYCSGLQKLWWKYMPSSPPMISFHAPQVQSGEGRAQDEDPIGTMEGWRALMRACRQLSSITLQNLATSTILQAIAEECCASFQLLTLFSTTYRAGEFPVQAVLDHIRTRRHRHHSSFLVECSSQQVDMKQAVDAITSMQDRVEVARALRFSIQKQAFPLQRLAVG